MDLILWIIFGAICGWIASIMIEARHPTSISTSPILLGITGALLGGFAMELVSGSHVQGLDIFSLLVAIGGSLLIVTLFVGSTSD